MVSAALALIIPLLLIEASGGAVAQGAGRGGENVLTRSKLKPTPADLDRSILLEWRKGSPQLQHVWDDEDAPVSAWHGVTVGAEGRVVKIEQLKYADLTGVPAALGGLTALETLDLSWNQLTSVPKELGNLAALEVLDLSSNNLDSVPAALGGLTALKMLILFGAFANQLETVPAELGKLTALTALGLYKNDLTSVPAEIGRLSALTRLDLSDNKMTSVPKELGEAVQVNPIEPTLKAPGSKHFETKM
jgi:hypothetical protein